MNKSPIIVLVIFCIASSAQANLSNSDLNDAKEAARSVAASEAKKVAEAVAKREFQGLNMGVGLSLTFDTGSNDRVEDAEIVDGVVRVTKERDRIARILLESHYFFTPASPFFGVPGGEWGWGPFFGIQPGTDDIIEAIGLGFMIGFRRAPDSSDSWNIGLGYIVDPEVKILGDGFEENQAPPGNETEVRFKTKSQQGVFLVFSASF